MKLIQKLALTCIAIASCTPTKSRLDSKFLDSHGNQNTRCSMGTPTSFTFGDLGFLPDPSTVRYGRENFQYRLLPQVPGNPPYIRLDTCSFDDTIELRQVVFEEAFASQQYILPVRSDSTVAGLKEAVFSEDQSKINIQVREADDSTRTLVISGWKQADGRTFATVTFATVTGTVISANSMTLLTGKLLVGDPLKSLKCAPGLNFRTAKFRLAQAAFEWDTCEGLGGGETTSYDVIGLRVTDSNPVLTPEESHPQSFDGKDAVGRVLTSKWGHHNACDSFVLTLPHATYAATSAPMAGCNTALPGAPTRQMDDDDDANFKTKFTISYNGVPPQPGLLNCPHHLFCREQEEL
jgi:hypothetical protein